MLLNLSNHPSSKWSNEQLVAAKQFGGIVDMQFPEVNPMGDEKYINQLAIDYLHKVKELACNGIVTVHIMGEMTYTYALVNMLLNENIDCIASTTERIVNEFGNGQKQATFRFVRFRNYIL
jgi:hypothetical protein